MQAKRPCWRGCVTQTMIRASTMKTARIRWEAIILHHYYGRDCWHAMENQLEPSDEVAIILSRSNRLMCRSARRPRHWKTIRIQKQPTIHFSRLPWIRGRERARTQRRALVFREKVQSEQPKRTVARDMVWSIQHISRLQCWQIMPHPRFCFVLNASRPLLELEQKFFNEQRAGNGMWHLTTVKFRHWTLNAEYQTDAVPVIAVFTKFDDLVVQLYNRDREEESRADASKAVKEKFEMPLENSRDRPKAYVCFEGAFICLLF